MEHLTPRRSGRSKNDATPVRLTGRSRAMPGGAEGGGDGDGDEGEGDGVCGLYGICIPVYSLPANFTWFIFPVVSGASRNSPPPLPSPPLLPFARGSSARRSVVLRSFSRIFARIIHPPARRALTLVSRSSGGRGGGGEEDNREVIGAPLTRGKLQEEE